MCRRNTLTVMILGAVASLVILPTSVQANLSSVTYGFTCITNNSVADAAIGEAQLAVTVSEVAGEPNQALFTFTNSGPDASSIAQIYFDDGTLLGIAEIDNSDPGVLFLQPAPNKIGDLPSGNNYDFNTTQDFEADADSPVFHNGVNPGESLGILFDLKDGQTWADTIHALDMSLMAGSAVDVTGGLRIGIHVQGFDDEYSEAFITTVPAPGAAVLGLFGLSMVSWIKRRFA